MKAFASAFEHDGSDYVVVSRPLGRPLVFAELTRAELAVAEGLLDGRSMRELAAQREVSERTIANQMAGVYRKLGIASRQELVALTAAGRASSGE
jgi:DNA-binding NarL/FixJ family response regulator